MQQRTNFYISLRRLQTISMHAIRFPQTRLNFPCTCRPQQNSFSLLFLFHKSAALQQFTKPVLPQRSELYVSLRLLQTFLCMPCASHRTDLTSHVPAGPSKTHFQCYFYFTSRPRHSNSPNRWCSSALNCTSLCDFCKHFYACRELLTDPI